MFATRLLIALAVLAVAPGISPAQTEGVAPNGKKGRLHVVQNGDTLWDICTTYLGTPWIWPSIWKENQIDNPHLIYPGDLVWITEAGVRKVTAEEAERLMRLQAQGEAEAGPEPAIGEVAPEPEPAAPEPEPQAQSEQAKGQGDAFGSLDSNESEGQHSLKYPGLHRYAFVTPGELAGAGSILGSHEESYWTSQERRTIVSLGEGQVHIGDSYTLFRTRRRVMHPETGKVVGYFVQTLGTAEVAEIHPETSFMKVVTAYAEIEPGDRLMPYQEEPSVFRSSRLTEDVRGVIIAQQPYRQYSAEGDLVILDRGAEDGVSRGAEVEVFRSGKEVVDPVTRTRLLVPDDVIGTAFILKVGDRTAVALLRSAARPVRVGDHFRRN
jgi:hypothetical protein